MTDEPNVLPQATIAPVPLAGEPATDRAFLNEADGRTYRVRTRRAAVADRPTGGTIVYYSDAIDITVTRLCAEGRVERNAGGDAVIVGRTRWTIDQDAAAAPGGLSLDEQLWMLVRNLIHTAALTADAPIAVDQLLAGWTADAPAPVPAAPVGGAAA